jgi:VCBS repeat-containing protein
MLNFSADQVEIDRAGDSLVFKFEDGAVVEVENFYVEHSKENLPEFQVEDRLVAGTEFFETFAPDIAPAAGVGVSERGGRYTNFADGDLLDGISHLRDLDWGMRLGGQEEREELYTGMPLSAARGRDAGDAGADAHMPPDPPPYIPPAPPPVEPPPVTPPPPPPPPLPPPPPTPELPTIVPDDLNGTPVGQYPEANGHNTVWEQGLGKPSGHDPFGTDGEGCRGTIQINAPEELDSVTIGDKTFTAGELENLSTLTEAQRTVESDKGAIKITDYDPDTGKLEYEYMLRGPLQHENEWADHLFDDFPLSVTDKLGQSGSGSLVIEIIDSTPTANDDTNALASGETIVSGNVLEDQDHGHGGKADHADTGVDGPLTVTGAAAGDTKANSSGGVGTVISGQYGTLTVLADGSYTYTQTTNPQQGSNDQDIFTYTITDFDFNQDHATLTIDVHYSDAFEPPPPPPPDAPVIVPDGGIVDEQGLRPGNTDDSHITTGAIKVSAPAGLAGVTIGDPGAPHNPGDPSKALVLTPEQLADLGTTQPVIDTGEGWLKLTGYDTATGEINYEYTLKGPVDQPNVTQTPDNIPLSVTDANGASQNGTLTIIIKDDVPKAQDDFNSATEGGPAVSGNVIGGFGAASTDQADVGVDGPLAMTGITGPNGPAVPDGNGGWNVPGLYGNLHIAADGSYTYTPTANLAPGEQQRDAFPYTITDSDGDIGGANLTITITGTGQGDPAIIAQDINRAHDRYDYYSQNYLSDGHNTVWESGLFDGVDNVYTGVDEVGSLTSDVCRGLIKAEAPNMASPQSPSNA